jgi:hypothetical protein
MSSAKYLSVEPRSATCPLEGSTAGQVSRAARSSGPVGREDERMRVSRAARGSGPVGREDERMRVSRAARARRLRMQPE